MSSTISPISSSNTVVSQSFFSTYNTVSRNLSHWLTSDPPYVNRSSGVTIERLPKGIEDLCKKSPKIINKFISYFCRICIMDNFTTTPKQDMMMIAMDVDGSYKAPSMYVFYVLYICLRLPRV